MKRLDWPPWRVRAASVWRSSDLRPLARGQQSTAIVAVACLAFTTAMPAVLYGSVASLTASLRAELTAAGFNVVVLHEKPPQAPCRLGDRRCEATRTRHRDGEVMRQLHRVHRQAGPRAQSAPVWQSVVSLGTPAHTVTLIGTEATLFHLQPIALREGRLWTVGDERAGRPVALLGRTVYDSLRRREADGQHRAGARGGVGGGWHGASGPLRIGPVIVDVIGVVESGPVSIVPVDDAILMPRAVFARAQSGPADPKMFIARTEARTGGSTLLDAWRRLERQQPSLAERVTISTTADQLGEIAQLESTLERGVHTLSFVLLGASLAAVAALMLTIARQHRRLVGIARAVGATRALITAQGLLVGLLIGTFGVCAGSLVAAAVLQLLPHLLDVPSLAAGLMARALLQASAPPLLMSLFVGGAAFARLARQPPAILLA